MATGTGTIDITATVNSASDTFEKAAEAYIIAQLTLVPGLGPIVISTWGGWLFADAIDWVVVTLTNWTVIQGMIGNTILRKTSQAIDYLDTKSTLSSLPTTATDTEYEKAEEAEIAAFNNLVLLTN